MKKVGCGVAVLGVLAVGGGGMLTCAVHIESALEANRVAAVPLVPGEEKTTEVLKVSTEKSCQIGVYLDLTTRRFMELDPGDYVARYRFPVTYKVSVAEGGAVFSEDTSAGHWSLSKLPVEEEVAHPGGNLQLRHFLSPPQYVRLKVEHRFAAFKVPPPGEIMVAIELGPDTEYEAKPSRAELRVYDNLEEAETVGAGPALIATGAWLALRGLGLNMSGAQRETDEREPSAP